MANTLEELIQAGDFAGAGQMDRFFSGPRVQAYGGQDLDAISRGLLNLKTSPNPQAQQEAALIEQILSAPDKLQQQRQQQEQTLMSTLGKLDPGFQGTLMERLFPGAGKMVPAAVQAAEAKRPVAMDPSLLSGIGTEGYLEKLIKAQEEGRVSESAALKLQQRHQVKEKQANDFAVDRRSLEDTESVHKIFSDVLSTYKETPAFQTGKFSKNMKIALAAGNQGITSLQQWIPVSAANLDESEQKFIAKYNQIFSNLRRLTGDPRFSDQDAIWAKLSVGAPQMGPRLFEKQLEAITETIADRHDRVLGNLEATGKNVKTFKKLRVEQPQTTPALTPDMAKKLLAEVGGDKAKARELAKQRGLLQ